jgi:alpha-amylase
MRKGTDGSQVITVLSNLGSSGASYTLSLKGTGYTAGQKLMEIYNCSAVTVGADGTVPVAMGQGQPRVFYPVDKLNGSLCS